MIHAIDQTREELRPPGSMDAPRAVPSGAREWGRGDAEALLVCSPGGHLIQLLALQPALEGYRCTWVTERAPDVDHLLREEEVLIGHGPTHRSLPNFLRNLRLAWRVVRRRRPEVIVSTGAALAVPFFFVGRLCGCRLVYVESLTRIKSLSLSGRMVYPLAHAFFVQWPDAARRRRTRYAGNVL